MAERHSTRRNRQCGSHIKPINLNVHDTGGIAAWSDGEGGEIYGCLIYYNGWKGPDRAHGHAIYAQSRHGTKRLIDNVAFWQFGYGIHCYGSPKASLQGFDVEGNAGFKNNSLSNPDGCSTDIYIGGQTPAGRITIKDNYTNGGLRCGDIPGASITKTHRSPTIISVGGLYVRDFQQLTVTGKHNRRNQTCRHVAGGFKRTSDFRLSVGQECVFPVPARNGPA